MRNLFTKFALVAALVTLVPAAALASDARVQALGLQGDYIQDYSNVYAYPSSIVRYQNLVYGNLGTKDVPGGDVDNFQDNSGSDPLSDSGRSMGAYLNNLKWLPGTWGIQINENANSLSPAYGAGSYNRNRNEGATLLWGNKVGEKIALGFALDKSNSSQVDATGTPIVTVKPYTWGFPGGYSSGANARQTMNNINSALGSEERNSLSIAGGLTYDFSSSAHQNTMDIAVRWRDESLELDNVFGQGTTISDNGGGSFAVNARAQMALTDNSYLTPVINYYTINRGVKGTDTVDPTNNFTEDNSVTGINVGVAESWVLRETDLLTLGLSYNHEKVDYETLAFEATYESTPTLFGALEVHPTGWLHLRLGASKPVWSKLEIIADTTVPAETLTLKDSPLQYSFGAGFRLGNRLDIDAVMNQDYAFTGGWAASGTSEQPFSQLSMTYRF